MCWEVVIGPIHQQNNVLIRRAGRINLSIYICRDNIVIFKYTKLALHCTFCNTYILHQSSFATMAPKRTRSSSGQQKLSFSVRKKESPISSVKDSIKKDIKSEKKQVHEPIEIIETKEENGKRHLDLESKEYEEYYAELTKNDVTGPGK